MPRAGCIRPSVLMYIPTYSVLRNSSYSASRVATTADEPSESSANLNDGIVPGCPLVAPRLAIDRLCRELNDYRRRCSRRQSARQKICPVAMYIQSASAVLSTFEESGGYSRAAEQDPESRRGHGTPARYNNLACCADSSKCLLFFFSNLEFHKKDSFYSFAFSQHPSL